MIAWLPAIWAADRADRQTPIDRLIRSLPTHGWHLRADALRLIAQIIAEARPRLVLELGSGSSTVLLARQCANLSGGTRVVSVEESPLFAANTRRLLRRHNLLDRVSIVVSLSSAPGSATGAGTAMRCLRPASHRRWPASGPSWR